MGFYHHYISAAIKIIQNYHGDKPFEFHLKHYFSQHKKHGSRDRKIVSDICYSYFRVASAFENGLNEENVINAFFLTHQTEHPLLLQLKPELNDKVSEPITSKLSVPGITAESLYPFYTHLSPGFQNQNYYLSFLKQPDIFLRIRPGKNLLVMQKLEENQIPFLQKDEGCINIKNSTQLRHVFETDKVAVIQDYSSQQVLDYLDQITWSNLPVKVWDCCAGSGGKSILLYDKLKDKIQLHVSDLRKTILKNLSQRFATAGIKSYRSFEADLTVPFENVEIDFYDLIICDAPCSGSGTWARTPEQLAFFKESSLQEYSQKQQKILANAIRCLKRDGFLFYITCSVFAEENEDLVKWALSNFKLDLQHQQYINGYLHHADNMFVAVFKMSYA